MIKMLQYKMYPAGELAVLRQLLLIIFSVGPLLKERICSCAQEQILSFKSKPTEKGLYTREANSLLFGWFSEEKGSGKGRGQFVGLVDHCYFDMVSNLFFYFFLSKHFIVFYFGRIR